MSKKFNKFLLLFLFVSFACFFVACDKEKMLEFNEANLTMSINQEIGLEEFVKLSNCDFDDIQFESSNPDIVYIKQNNTLVSRAVGVSIISAKGFEGPYLEVTVVGEEVKFSAPKNLRYEKEENAVIWDTVSEGLVVATEFDVTLTSKINGNTNERNFRVVGNKLVIEDAGEYSVKVACASKLGIKGSDYSDVFSFKKLSSPTNLKYNDTTGVLSWDADGASSFKVKVNGVESSVINQKNCVLNLNEEGTYTISVISFSMDDSLYSASSVEKIKLTRLGSPSITVAGGIASWEYTNSLVNYFKVDCFTAENLGETTQVPSTSAGNYSFDLNKLESGTYTLTVTAVGTVNGEIGAGEYILSATSSEVTFTKYDKPSSLIYNDQSGKLSWNAGNGELFVIIVNGEEVLTTDKNEGFINIVNPGKYNIKVKSVSVSDTKSFGQTSTEEINIKRLPAPTLTVNNGIISWEGQNGAESGYMLKVEGQKSFEVGIKVNDLNSYSYDLSNEDAGNYVVKVMAVGKDDNRVSVTNGSFVFESDWSIVEGIERLNPVSIIFDETNRQIKVDNFISFGELNLKLYETFNDVDTKEYDISSGVQQFDFEASGTYNYKVVNLAKTSLEINSIMSNQITVVKLPKSQNVTHSIQEGKYYVENYEVDGADNYVIEIFKGSTSKIYDVEDNLISELFSEVGTYGIRIFANAQNGQLAYYVGSTTTTNLKITKPNDCALTVNSDKMQISWLSLIGKAGLTYNYEITGATTQNGTTEKTNFDFKNFDEGKYTFTVWTDLTTLGDEIVLGTNKKSIEFEVYEKLATPNVEFTKNKESENEKYYLEIEPVQNATHYVILNNENEIARLDYSANIIKYDITNLINGTVENISFEITAENKDNIYINSSNATEVKIRRADVPNSFELDANEKIFSYSMANWYESCEIKITNEDTGLEYATNDLGVVGLNGATNYLVKLRFISNNNKVGDSYYLDSMWTAFRLSRLQTGLEAHNNILVWNDTDSEKIITISQNGKESTQIDVTSENNFDLFSIDNNKYDLDEGVTLKLQSKIYSLTDNFVGMYLNNEFINNLQEKTVISIKNFYISSIEDELTVKMADNELNLQMDENADEIDIIFNRNASANYSLFGAENFKITSSKITSNVNNKYGLEEKLNGKTTIYLFTIGRLNEVQILNVDKNENLTASNIPSDSILVCTLDGQEITNLSDVLTGSKTVLAKFITNNKINDNTFMLNSIVSEFNFKRLEKFSNDIVVNNNVLSIVREDDQNLNYSYKIIFSDENNIEYIKIFDNAENLTINLLETEYSEIIYSLGQNKTISINKVTKQTSCEKDSTMYLTSGYSTPTSLKVLDAPTNLQVEMGEGYGQNDFVISCNLNQNQLDSGYGFSKFRIKLYYNGAEQVIDADKNNMPFNINNTNFNQPGEWKFMVWAEGTGDTISSTYSEIRLIRLAQTGNISISSTGLVSWNGVQGASSYVLTYKDVNTNGSILSATRTTNGLSYQLSSEELDMEFDGNILFTLYAMGDGISTLSSTKSVEFLRESAPEIEMSSDHITVTNYKDYNNTDVFVRACIDNYTVLNKAIEIVKDSSNNYVWYYPATFSYVQNGKVIRIDFSNAKDIDFTFYATSKNNNVLNSNIVEKSATKLAQIKNIKFYRGQDQEIRLSAVNPNLEFNDTQLMFAGSTNIYNNSNVDVAIKEEWLSSISETWELIIRAKGGVILNKVYIDGPISTISGTKLEAVTNVKTSAGSIVWDGVVNATDYAVNVDKNINILNHKTGLKETLSGSQYAPGLHTICVKAIGNIDENGISENVILDGSFSESIDITKLAQISNIDVKNGLFTFDAVENAENHKIVLYQNLHSQMGEFNLYEYQNFLLGETNIYYTNDDLIRSLTDSAEYLVKFYASSTKDGFINSDISTFQVGGEERDYIVIEVMPRYKNEIILSHPTVNQIADYTKTNIALTLSNLAQSGILLSTSHNDEEALEYIPLPQIISEYVYQLNADSEWDAGKYEISYSQLGSNEIDVGGKAYITSGFGDKIIITKLAESNLSTELNEKKENGIRYSSVNGADAYYVYIGETYSALLIGSGDRQISLNDLPTGDYSSVRIIAVNTQDDNIIASRPSILKDKESNVVAIKKIFAPSGLKIQDGAMYFELDDSNVTTAFVREGITTSQIFTQSELFKTQRIRIKFTNIQTLESFVYEDYLNKFVKFTDDQLSYLELLGRNQYRTNNASGFPSTNFNFNDLAQSLNAGEYNIQFQIVGNQSYKNTLLITSNYSESVTRYISSAPMIKIENNDDTFNLKFKNITVNTKYFDNENPPCYAIVGSYKDSISQVTMREILTTVSASGINNSEELVVNLTELVQNDILTSKFKTIEVFVMGDDDNVLNGRMSNILNVEVLDPISAIVQHGIFKWNAQVSASKYYIYYGSNLKSVDAVYLESLLEWDGLELEDGQTYEVKAYAYGSLEKNPIGTVVISGKITELGEIYKLPAISGLRIQNGIYVWDLTQFASGYDVFVNGYDEEFDLNSYVSILDNSYSTTVLNNDPNHYRFRAIGTEEVILSGDTLAYINSKITSPNISVRMPNVSEVGAIDGVLKWSYDLNNVWFKISIYKESDYNLDNESLIIDIPASQVLRDEVCYLDLNNYPSLNEAGRYNIKIQAYYVNQTQVPETEGQYYLISIPVENTFTKFAPVSDISVNNGVIDWSYFNEEVANYFKLEFEYNGNTEVRYIDDNTNFIEVVSQNDINDNIVLRITVIPGRLGSADENKYLMSSTVTYNGYLYQLNKIDDNSIRLSVKDNGKLLISWANPDNSISVNNYVYEIAYRVGDNSEIKYVQVNEENFTFGENEENFTIEDRLYYAIRVKAVGLNYLSSAYCDLKMIELPKSVSEVEYDNENYKFTWSKYEVEEDLSSSISYKIKDEIGVINQSGTFEVQKVLLFDASVGDESFTPFITGIHRVSVAAIIKNGNSDDLISSYTTPIICNFNIFDGGDGTEENPYLITNESQFNNIKYRLNKDSKNNQYYECSIVNNVLNIPEVATTVTSNNLVYHFKQMSDLTITKDYTLANKVVNGELSNVSYEFNGNYDGNYLKLELLWEDAINSSLRLNTITIFEKVGTNGTLQNINLFVSVTTTQTISKAITFSILTSENQGTIKNIKIGDNASTLKLTSTQSITFTFIASSNRGRIIGVKNNYNVEISVGSYVTFATVVINNYNSISQAQNKGEIKITANYTSATGGIVALLYDKNSSITQSANLGDLSIFLRNNSTSNIGGVIGVNNGAEIKECYSICDITVYSNTNLTNTNVGGLIGQSTGDNITRSYTAVTQNQKTLSGNAYFGIYQVIGKLNSYQSGDAKAYYKEQSGFSPVGTTSGVDNSYIAYQNTPSASSTLFENGSSFSFVNVNSNGYPILEWENAFDQLNWKN